MTGTYVIMLKTQPAMPSGTIISSVAPEPESVPAGSCVKGLPLQHHSGPQNHSGASPTGTGAINYENRPNE